MGPSEGYQLSLIHWQLAGHHKVITPFVGGSSTFSMLQEPRDRYRLRVVGLQAKTQVSVSQKAGRHHSESDLFVRLECW